MTIEKFCRIAIRVEGEIVSVMPSSAAPMPDAPEGGVVTLVPGIKVGNAQVTAKADADLGEGQRELVT
jgi:hypothetical protein